MPCTGCGPARVALALIEIKLAGNQFGLTPSEMTHNGKRPSDLIREDGDSTAGSPRQTATAPALAPTEVARRGPRRTFESKINSREPELSPGRAGSGFLSARRGAWCAPSD